ncbi:MAG TPA: S49 family peptidase [Pseudonocardia sp.]|jgi:signal peptide peptidase SppA
MTTLLDKLPKEVTDRLPGKLAERMDRSVVSLVRLHGVITPAHSPVPRSVINLSTVEPVLKRAFEPDRLAAVALVINSPGGAATQSALIADRIRGLAEEHQVPVLAFCEDVAASGGYWLACAADEIWAHQTSLVGSIGVVSGGFGLSGLIERLGVERRLHTAGTNKARLDPFLPEKPEDVAWLTGMQGQLHEMFQQWVRSRRGDKLAGEDAELFTGEVWTGREAVKLGLIDGLGTPREVLAERFPDAEPVLVEGRKPLLARLGVGAGLGSGAVGLGGNISGTLLAELAGELLGAIEHRAAWARFGL